MTVAFAKEFGPKVRVNCIMCGPFHTDISKGWSRSRRLSPSARRRPFRCSVRARPEEVVGAALYFAGPAASYTTGTIMTIDGGSSDPIVRTVYE